MGCIVLGIIWLVVIECKYVDVCERVVRSHTSTYLMCVTLWMVTVLVKCFSSCYKCFFLC